MYVILNSENKSTGDNNNCIIPIKTFLPKGRVSLLSARVPMTYYNITSVNNLIKLNGSTYQINAGNYDLTELLAELTTQTPSHTYIYNSITGRITITYTGVFSLDFSISNSLASTLGFENILYSGSSFYIAPNPPKIFDNYIFCNIAEINTGCLSSSNFNITFPLPVANKNEVVEFNKNSHYCLNYCIKQPISSFNISFRDEANNLLQNLGNFSLILEICEYK